MTRLESKQGFCSQRHVCALTGRTTGCLENGGCRWLSILATGRLESAVEDLTLDLEAPNAKTAFIALHFAFHALDKPVFPADKIFPGLTGSVAVGLWVGHS
jgi:hypothetical protein